MAGHCTVRQIQWRPNLLFTTPCDTPCCNLGLHKQARKFAKNDHLTLIITCKESQMLCAIVKPGWECRVLHPHPHSLWPSSPSGYTFSTSLVSVHMVPYRVQGFCNLAQPLRQPLLHHSSAWGPVLSVPPDWQSEQTSKNCRGYSPQ